MRHFLCNSSFVFRKFNLLVLMRMLEITIIARTVFKNILSSVMSLFCDSVPLSFSFWCISKAVQHPTQNRHTISSKYLYFYTRSGSCVNWALYYTVFVYKHVWKVKAGNSCSACHRLWTIILDVSRAFKYCTCKDFLRMYVISMQFVMHSPWKHWKS